MYHGTTKPCLSSILENGLHPVAQQDDRSRNNWDDRGNPNHVYASSQFQEAVYWALSVCEQEQPDSFVPPVVLVFEQTPSDPNVSIDDEIGPGHGCYQINSSIPADRIEGFYDLDDPSIRSYFDNRGFSTIGHDRLSKKIDPDDYPFIQRSSFRHGYCHEFTVALHEKTGWDLRDYRLVDDQGGFVSAHTVCVTPDDQLVDIDGIKTDSDIRDQIENPENQTIQAVDITNQTLENTVRLYDEKIDQAREWLRHVDWSPDHSTSRDVAMNM